MNPVPFTEDDAAIAAAGYQRITFGEGQPQYRPLPALVGRMPEREVRTRWQPTEEEFTALMLGHPIELTQLTFGGQLQPVRLEVQGVDYSEASRG